MAVAAINAVVADVVFVRELYGLLTLNELSGVVRRAIYLGDDPERSGDEKDSAEDAHLGNRVRAAVEYLHVLSVCLVTL